MRHDEIAPLFEATVVLSTVTTFALALWAKVAPQREPSPLRVAPTKGQRALAVFAHPFAQLLLVCGLLFANQVLCHAYILRAHGGDASFVTRYLGLGWFAIARENALVRFVAGHVGDAHWLSPTVLRVQAFLELPFALFAYLAVARMLGRDVVDRIVRIPWILAASVSFTITFCLVELSLPNPWTTDDLVLRWISAAVTPAWVVLAARLRPPAPPPSDDRPKSILGLLAFLAGAGAIAFVVLAVYDALLLYNLAHLPRYASGLVVATAIAIAASWAAPRADRLERGMGWAVAPTLDGAGSAIASFTTLFFVPSLCLRYWGAHSTALACGLFLVVTSVAVGLGAAATRTRGITPARTTLARLRLVTGTLLGVVVGGWASAHMLAGAARAAAPELLLAKASLVFLAVAIVMMRVSEVVLGGGQVKAVCSAAHEEEAQVDEA